MAKDNGLYLPLKIKLDDWEKSLMEANADLQKSMRQMKSATKDLSLKYDIKIAGAKAAGDAAKVLELENRKLNQIFETQRRTVDALNKAYQQSVKEKGADAKASTDLAKQLLRESKALDKIQMQLDSKKLNFGKGISDGLAAVSPQFASIRMSAQNLTGALQGISPAGLAAAKALGGIAVVAGGIAVGAAAFEKITGSVTELGDAASQANDPIFQFREQLETTYQDAEDLAGILNIDGVGLETYAATMNKLNKTIQKAGENGNVATDMLQRWHVELRNGDGSRKTAIEQLREMADGYKRAQAAGEGQDFLTATGTTSLVHVLNDMDGYLAKWKAIQVEYERNYQLSHDLAERTLILAEAQKQLNAVKGDTFLQAANDARQREIDAAVIEAKVIAGNKKEYEEMGRALSDVSNFWTDLKLTASLTLDKIIMAVIAATNKVKEWLAVFQPVINGFKWLLEHSSAVAVLIGGMWKQSAAEVEEYRKQVEAAKNEVAQKAETRVKTDERTNAAPVDVKGEREKAAALEKEKSAREKFSKEMRDLQASDYEREINAIRDKTDEYIKSGIAKIDAEKMFALEKERIDQKYFQKLHAEREKQAKDAEAAYKTEIENAKKARETAISDAEATLKNNIKLVRYIQRQRQAGNTNWQADARAYADKLYMKQSGIKMSDIAGLKSIGVDTVKQIADARSRLFADFAPSNVPAQTMNNNVTINFDNTVLDNVSAMDLLAQKVAAIIDNSLRQAMANNRQGANAYGY